MGERGSDGGDEDEAMKARRFRTCSRIGYEHGLIGFG